MFQKSILSEDAKYVGKKGILYEFHSQNPRDAFLEEFQSELFL